ncbi:hypothetical protein GCM10022268_17440 [Sphingomonas cynarae]|uniref:Calx-beta domain-containing protein n=1 Tax=Sphingomonas cynarae TaxID=930197 RepID=A0ABP7DSU6_9SPHN
MAYDFARPLNVILPELVSALAMAQADLARPVVYLTEAVVSTPEGNSGTKTLTITARRSTLVGTLSVLGLFVQGTAIATDFPGGLPGNKTWNFPAGSDTATVDIAINGDTDVESDETFGYQLQTGSTYRLGTPSGVTGTILNDDATIVALANVMIVGDGDSKTPEMLYAMRRAAERNGLDIDWSGTNQGPEGAGVGGSTSTQMVMDARIASTVAKLKPYTDAGRILDIAVHSCTNGAEPAADNVANYEKYYQQVFKAVGGRCLYVSSVNPDSVGGGRYTRVRETNIALRAWCDTKKDAVFVDEEPYLIDPDPANTEGRAIPYTFRAGGGAPANSVMRDTVHKSQNGSFRASFAYDAPMKARHTQIAPLVVANSNAYSSTNLRGNLGGPAQRTVAGPPGDLIFDAKTSGSATFTWSTSSVVVPASVGFIQPGTFSAARLSFGGTTAEYATGLGASPGFSQFYQSLSPRLSDDARVRGGILLRFNDVRGLMGWSIGAGAWFGQETGSANANTSTSPLAEVIYDPVSGFYFLDTNTFPAGDKGLAQALMGLRFGPNVAISGSVDILIANYLRKVN